MNKSLLTASRMAAWLACPRKHFWRYEMALQPATKSDALRFGTAWHSAMEARWRGADYDTALAAALPEGVDLDAVQCATLAGLLAGYYRQYSGTEIVKELHPEVEFRQKLAGSRTFDVAGKIDGLGVLHDGRIALIEHKTCGEDIGPESEYWLRLRANPQIMQYVLAARALGWNVEQVIYDVTRKPAIRVKQNETPEQFAERLQADCADRPEFYFARREVPVLDQDLVEFQTQRLVLARTILNCRGAEKSLLYREQAWPRNLSGMTCRYCEFSSFCLQNIKVNPNQPPTGFQIGPANPELNGMLFLVFGRSLMYW
jgi:hypothetical protein